MLASASHDGTVHVWAAPSPNEPEYADLKSPAPVLGRRGTVIGRPDSVNLGPVPPHTAGLGPPPVTFGAQRNGTDAFRIGIEDDA